MKDAYAIVISVIIGLILFCSLASFMAGSLYGVKAPRTNTEAQLKQNNEKCYSKVSEAEGKYKILLNNLASGALALSKK